MPMCSWKACYAAAEDRYVPTSLKREFLNFAIKFSRFSFPRKELYRRNYQCLQCLITPAEREREREHESVAAEAVIMAGAHSGPFSGKLHLSMNEDGAASQEREGERDLCSKEERGRSLWLLHDWARSWQSVDASEQHLESPDFPDVSVLR